MPSLNLCDDHSWAGEGECPKCEKAFAGMFPEPRVPTDDALNNLWLTRTNLHGGDLLPQLRDFAHAVLALKGRP